MGNSKRTPKYKLIENYILQKIKGGEYQKGNAIETEQVLIDKFNVSRVTVRQATNNLVAKGFLSRSQGSGTYVTNQNVMERSTNVKSFTQEMLESGKTASTEIIEFKVIPASEEIANKLLIKQDDPIYFIKRLRKADAIPMMLETNYMDVKRYPNLSYESIGGSKYEYVEEATNESIDHSHHIVLPIMPSEEIVRYFNCDHTTPLLKVLNSTYLSNGDLLDFTELILNTDEYQYQSVRGK
ncbi:GntR family transcriptional regulator, mannosyl-D-glycerate transport/metabolism system repressor [Amphibacillus marinus]|uniref:GntR family transcriptional regulator, mannosyl-D-glycerate transport/metabolism system repressor n=1 Tax=Amphibacillus marinus TaxID=872970 RepID=A0A1H8TG24_9BACI|nr:GntR family transcriptional regulator [Amphibacillus marinus]SEO89862.1 GntR family transcriptional regulator, mannosyl-D-glycerate transport/metabolism system repressor [Amphibacillus marinus]